MSADNSLEIVTTPTFDWLSKRARACRSRMLIASPYVNDGIMELTDLAPQDVTRTLITRTDLRDFAMRASSLETLCTLARDGVSVYSLSRLHAKMYIFDDTSALVTSANATYSGMRRNLECGLVTRESRVVDHLSRSLMQSFGPKKQKPKAMGVKDLEDLHIPLSTIQVSLPQIPPTPTPGDTPDVPEPEFSVTNDATLLEGFSGWTNLTLRGVMTMPKGDFPLPDLINVITPLAEVEYPGNHHVAAKVRQQLQTLRDRGIVEFVDNRGVYRRTMHQGTTAQQ